MHRGPYPETVGDAGRVSKPEAICFVASLPRSVCLSGQRGSALSEGARGAISRVLVPKSRGPSMLDGELVFVSIFRGSKW